MTTSMHMKTYPYMRAFVLGLGMCITAALPLAASASQTSGTVSGTNKYAWSSNGSWINFAPANGGITITDSGITGYVWSANYGWINMAPTNGGVHISSSGALSGYAWGTSVGWIDFTGVSISSTGVFSASASNSILGTLTFSCTNCSVTTDYVPETYRSTTTTTSSGTGGGGILTQEQYKNTDPVVLSETNTTDETSKDEQTLSGIFGSALNKVRTLLFIGGVNPDTSDTSTSTQLFDIRLLVDEKTVSSIDKLSARVTFDSFGNVPTPVTLTYTITDSTGKEVYRSYDTTTVETQKVVLRRFADLQLPEGSYTLTVHTKYNGSVEDNFSQPFVIGTDTTVVSVTWQLWVFGGALLIFLILLVIFWLRRKMARR